MLTKLKHEIKSVGITTLYFLFCFWLIVALRSLFLSEFGQNIYGYSAAALGALVIAKVIVIVDATSFGKRFKESRRSLHISYLSIVYTFWVFIVVLIEHFIRFARSEGGFATALSSGLSEIWWPLVLAKTIFAIFY